MNQLISLLASILLIFNQATNAQVFTFTQLAGVTYTAMANPDSRVVATLAACQSGCSLNCDFYSYDSVSKMCSYQTTDKSALYSTAFKVSATTAVYFYGEITGLAAISSPVAANQKACADNCLRSPTCK
jgi:hypothetical protein